MQVADLILSQHRSPLLPGAGPPIFDRQGDRGCLAGESPAAVLRSVVVEYRVPSTSSDVEPAVPRAEPLQRRIEARGQKLRVFRKPPAGDIAAGYLVALALVDPFLLPDLLLE